MYRVLIILGVTVGFLSITLTTPLVTQVSPAVEEVAQTDADHQKDPTQPEVTVQSMDALISTTAFSFAHDIILIHVLPPLEGTSVQQNVTEPQALPGSKVLKILFRRIISPNAP